MIEHAGDRKMHAVGRRAIDVMKAVGSTPQLERTVQGQRIAGAAAVAFGGDHDNFGNLRQMLGKAGQTGRKIAIVITDQDTHRKSGMMNMSDRCDCAISRECMMIVPANTVNSMNMNRDKPPIHQAPRSCGNATPCNVYRPGAVPQALRFAAPQSVRPRTDFSGQRTAC